MHNYAQPCWLFPFRWSSACWSCHCVVQAVLLLQRVVQAVLLLQCCKPCRCCRALVVLLLMLPLCYEAPLPLLQSVGHPIVNAAVVLCNSSAATAERRWSSYCCRCAMQLLCRCCRALVVLFLPLCSSYCCRCAMQLLCRCCRVEFVVPSWCVVGGDCCSLHHAPGMLPAGGRRPSMRTSCSLQAHQLLLACASAALCERISCSLRAHKLLPASASAAPCMRISCSLHAHQLLPVSASAAPCMRISCSLHAHQLLPVSASAAPCQLLFAVCKFRDYFKHFACV